MSEEETCLLDELSSRPKEGHELFLILCKRASHAQGHAETNLGQPSMYPLLLVFDFLENGFTRTRPCRDQPRSTLDTSVSICFLVFRRTALHAQGHAETNLRQPSKYPRLLAKRDAAGQDTGRSHGNLSSYPIATPYVLRRPSIGGGSCIY